MSAYTQLFRPLAVESALGDELLLVGFRGHEAISELFRFELDLLSPNFLPIPFDQVLGQPLAVRIGLIDGSVRRFHGVCSRLTQGKRDEDFTTYRAEVVPNLWRFTRTARSRIFQQIALPDLLKQILDPLRPNVTFDLRGKYYERDFCVQYRETDFAFLSRIMEEEGVFYYFRHAADGHTLIVTDNLLGVADVPETSTVLYRDIKDAFRKEVRIWEWEKSQELRSGKVTLWDHCFELPGPGGHGFQNLESKLNTLDQVQVGLLKHKLEVGGNDAWELYDYPGGFAQRFDGVQPGGGDRSADLPKIFDDGQRVARLRMEEETARGLELRGAGDCGHFLPGHRFNLIGHFDGTGTYLLTRVEHEAVHTGYRSGETAKLDYKNRFACLPKDLAYRPPRRTPKPVIQGTQTAVVTGPAEQQIFIDKYGRVKVQFPWDRDGKYNADSSCWVRVGQFWAGNRWGAFFWPRIGHEVVVSFEEGDPDRPIVVGSVYNAANMPPLAVPDSQDACGIKSCSVGGDPNDAFNCIVFHDTPDDEHLQFHSETHEVFSSQQSKYSYTPGTHFQFVGTPLFDVGSGGGGGVATAQPPPGGMLSRPPQAATSVPKDTGRESMARISDPDDAEPDAVGSGSGGGVLEIPMFVANQGYHTDWAEAYSKIFPGAASFVYGSQIGAVMFGDRNAHIIGGADIRMVFDLEAMTIGALLDKLPILGPLIAGVGGSAAFVCGPNASLVYGGPNLSVTRGDAYQYQTGKFWTDWSAVGVVTKLLTVLIAAATTVGDVLARQKAHFQYARTSGKKGQSEDDEEHEKEDTAVKGEYPEWALFLGTAVPSRLLALLIQIETVKAELENAKAKGEEAAHHAQHAAALAPNAPWYTVAANRIKAGLRSAANCLETLAPYDGKTAPGNKLQVFEGNYAIRAKDITLTSQDADPTNVGGTHITLNAQGGPPANNGAVTLTATNTVEMGVALAKIGVQLGGVAQGKIEMTAPPTGSINLQTGTMVTPQYLKITGTPPSVELGVDPLMGGPKIKLSATGITFTFAAWEMTLDASGFTVNVTPNSVLKVSPTGIVLNGLDIKLASTLQEEFQTVMLSLDAQGLQKINTALSQME